jgi:hypothetical protein
VQTPPLPPPPGWQSSTAPPAPIEPHSVADPRPTWRRGHVGWSLLHLAIGIGIWFASFFAVGIALGIAGRTDGDIERMPAWIILPPLVGGVVGWLCFAYLRTSIGRRWIVFGGLVGVTYLVAVWAALATTD